MTEDAKAPTWPHPSQSGDFWHRDAATTLERFRAEKAVREYAKERAWGEIRFRHVGELVREVPVALWSVTVRDLIAEAVMPARLDVAAVYTVTRTDETGERREESRPVVLTGNRKKVSQVAVIAETTPSQAEAAAMLCELADFFRSPSRLGTPLPDLDTGAKREALTSGRKLSGVRRDLAAKLGSTLEAYTRAVRRAKTAPKKPRR